MSLAPVLGSVAAAALFATTDTSFANVTFMSEFNTQYTQDESPDALQVSLSGLNIRQPGKFTNGGAIQSSRDAGSAAVVNDNTAIPLSNSDFTIEFWIKLSAVLSTTTYITGKYHTTAARSWHLQWRSTSLEFVYSTDGTTDQGTARFRLGVTNDGVTNATLGDNSWHHIAITRTGSSLVIHIDGFPGVTHTIGSSTIFDAVTSSVMIGSRNNAATGRVATNLGLSNSTNAVHLIDEYRITVGSARYSTSSFTPSSLAWPRGAANDASWSNVKLLLGFDDHWTGNTYGSGGAIFAVTSSSYQSSPEIVDSDGLYCPTPTSIGIKWNANTGFDLSGSDFTLEIFKLKITIPAVRETYHIAGVWGATTKCYRIVVLNRSIYFTWTVDGTTVQTLAFVTDLTSTVTYTMDLAVICSGSTLTLYKDGVQVSSGSLGGTLQSNAVGLSAFSLYNNNSNGDGAPISMRMKAVRVTKAVRYAGSTYTVPLLPLPKY